MNQIQILNVSCPDVQQKNDMSELAAICRQHDRISLSCPLAPEDEAQHLLLYGTNEGQHCLLSTLSMLRYDDETVECTAFTHPDHRRQGYFSELLNRALEWVGDCDILFPVSGRCADTLAVLDSLEAELDSIELQMELDLAENRAGETETDFSLTESCPDLKHDMTKWLLYQNLSEQKLLGSCQTSVISESSVCLHHVEILPALRGRGYGTVLMKRLITALQNQGFSRIILQVSGDNDAALALYKKQGFRITETLSFYLY